MGIIAFLGAAGSFAFGGFIADKILHQNEGKDTHDNSIKQLEIWGYDTEGFEAKYNGTEVTASASDGNMVPGMELVLKEMFGEGDTKSFMAAYLTGTSRFFMKLVYGIDYDDGDTIAKASDIKLPTLIICSDKDEVCLPDQVSKVYGNIACKDKAFLHFDSAHIEGVIDDPEGYMDGVEKFLGNAGL